MGNFHFLSRFSSFVSAGELPLWVVSRQQGIHPSRHFHTHNYSEIVIITEGQGLHLLDSQSVSIRAGDILIVHPGVIHAYDRANEIGIINVLFEPSRLSLPILDGYTLPLFKKIFPENNDCKCSAEPVMHLEYTDLQELLLMLKKLEDELKNIHPGKQLRSFAIFVEIVVFLARKCGTEVGSQQMNFLIGDAVRYMNNHYAEAIKVEFLAKKANMSLRSFTRHFPEAVGCSPIEYLMKVRLQHSLDLLINTDLPISEIAGQCGFYDSNYFCKKFRQTFQESPRKFRINFQLGKGEQPDK